MKLPDNDRILLTAQRMLESEYKPVIIYPKGFQRTANGEALGKEPFGKGWGEKEVTFQTIEEDISYFDRLGSIAGVGILLGPGRAPGGKGLADLDGDGVMAEDSFGTLFAGEVVESIGHFSERGRHLFIAYDYERVKAMLKRFAKAGYQSKERNQSGVFHLPQLPDLELRLGGFHDNGKIKQLQTVIPPTPGTAGEPRRWNGIKTLADAPEAFYAFLERAAQEAQGHKSGGTEDPKPGDQATRQTQAQTRPRTAPDAAGRYLIGALERTVGRIATAPVGERHAMLMSQAASLARYLHYGHGFTELDLETAILAGANLAAPERAATGENIRCVRDAIAFGKTIPKQLPDDLHAIVMAPAPVEDKVTFDAPPQAHTNGTATHEQARQAPGKKSGKKQKVDWSAFTDADMGMIDADDIEEKSITWLWKYRLQTGAMALLSGMAGIGKTQLLINIAATVSNGDPWPDGSGNAIQGRVIICSGEDDIETTLKPRIVASGANRKLITVHQAKLQTPVVANDDEDEEDEAARINLMSLQDIGYWIECFKRRPDTRLFIVDPLPSYLGRGVNDAKNVELRGVIEPFIQLVVRRFKLCMLCNTHVNKNIESLSAIHRISGSHAYGDIPRNVHVAIKDHDDKSKRYFAQPKCNDAPDDLPALVYRITRADYAKPDGEMIETTKVTFDTGTENIDVDSMMGPKPKGEHRKPGPKSQKTMECAEWLYDYLAAQTRPQPWYQILNAAGLAGFAGTQNESTGYWSNKQTLSNAKGMIPKLPSPRDGAAIVESEAETGRGRRVYLHWNLEGDNIYIASDHAGDAPENAGRKPVVDAVVQESDTDRVELANAVRFVTLMMIGRKSITMDELRHGSTQFDIPLDKLVRATEVLNLDKIIDSDTGDESWERTGD